MGVTNFVQRRLSDSRLGYSVSAFVLGLTNTLFNMMDFAQDVPLGEADTMIRLLLIVVSGLCLLIGTLSLIGYAWRRKQLSVESAMSSRFNPYLKIHMDALALLCEAVASPGTPAQAKLALAAKEKLESLEFGSNV